MTWITTAGKNASVNNMSRLNTQTCLEFVCLKLVGLERKMKNNNRLGKKKKKKRPKYSILCIIYFNYLMGGYREDGGGLFSDMHRARDSRQCLEHGKLQLEVG